MTHTNDVTAMQHTSRAARTQSILTYAVVTCVGLAGLGATDASGQSGHDDVPGVASLFEITALSARPDMVSGGDVLVRVDTQTGVHVQGVRMTLNGADVTDSFRLQNPTTWIGLVSGLVRGANELIVTHDVRPAHETLALDNHSITGPVFSGPHETPFICETDAFPLISGQTLGQPLDDGACSVERRVDYAYRSTNESADGLVPLDDPQSRPADLATTTTLNDVEVPYIVRIETGTINRAVYQIAMLHNPGTEPDPDAWTPAAGWNRRLIYTFGGGCVNGWYRQGRTTGGVTDDAMLRQGYAVASSSLNVYGNNCNDLLAAETMMMVKERFIEGYGLPNYTIGWGCSGGSYQNHQIADNYPGLLDGIIPGCSFPDVAFGTVPMITDARLLNEYFENDDGSSFSEEQQRAVAGFLTLATMPNVARNAGRISVGEFCPDVLPESMQYHPIDNPTGARCDLYDHYVNVYGRDPDTGFARRPLDNVGVQYGLHALNDETITTEQFLDLNERIGGYDHDGNIHQRRTTADTGAVRVAYETGRLTNGGGGLATTPVIDYRAYSDDREAGDVHVRYHSFSIRERLEKANGHTDNHIMMVEDDRYGLYSTESPVLRDALRQMDRWLENITADTSGDSRIDVVRRAKPADLVDACWSRDVEPVKIAESQVRGSGQCHALYPAAPSPREVAGAPLASDIVKCQLMPIDPAAYQVTLTPGDTDRLRSIFPSGVCDWSKPGIEQTALTDTWLDFSQTGETAP